MLPQVFQPANLGSLELKNRLIHSATFECMADENGAVTDHLVNAVHEADGLIAFQPAHGGRQCPKKVIGKAPLAPSGFGHDPASMNKPAAATEADIQEVITSFAKAAKRAFDAGADAIQLYCAHGYLLNEFLSPFFNRRHDQFLSKGCGKSPFWAVVLSVHSVLQPNFRFQLFVRRTKKR